MRGPPSESDQEALRQFESALSEESCLYCGDPDVWDGNDLQLCASCWVAELVEMARYRDESQVRDDAGVAFHPDTRSTGYKARRRAREVLREQ